MDEGGESKATVSVSVKQGTNGVAGAKILLTNTINTSSTYESTSSGTAGGCSISEVPYGTYSVTVSTVPSGYTAGTYSNLVVDSATETLDISLTTA